MDRRVLFPLVKASPIMPAHSKPLRRSNIAVWLEDHERNPIARNVPKISAVDEPIVASVAFSPDKVSETTGAIALVSNTF